MLELQRLRLDHESAVLAFELANRGYFADWVGDRGDEYFEKFTERHRAVLADQEAGVCAFHVLVDEGGEVVGRFNLYDLVDGSARVGYRVAQRVAGRGVATSGLQELCLLAHGRYGLQTLTAAARYDNLASRRVLAKAGFVATGPAEVGGGLGSWYERSGLEDGKRESALGHPVLEFCERERAAVEPRQGVLGPARASEPVHRHPPYGVEDE